MKNVIDFLRNLLRHHKGKIFLTLVLTLAFTILFFPYGDLADWISVQIYRGSNNQVYVQFEDMDIAMAPKPGFRLQDVLIETPEISSIRAGSMLVAPSFLSLLKFRPSISVSAEDLLGGEVDLAYEQMKGENDQKLARIDVEAEQVRLNELTRMLGAASGAMSSLQGELRGEMDMVIDPNGVRLPVGTLNLGVDDFQMNTFRAQTGMGPLDIPGMKFEKVQVVGAIDETGQFQIQQGQIGNESDLIQGQFTGHMNLSRAGGGGFQVGSYDLNINLLLKQELSQKPGMDFFISALEAFDNIGTRYKSVEPGGARYRFRVTATSAQAPPRIQPPRSE